MPDYSDHIYQQAVLIVGSNSDVDQISNPDIPVGDPSINQLSPSVSGSGDVMLISESIVLKTTFSSVPIIWESELSQKYWELGEALSEMTELQVGDEWKIDAAVYDAARYVAAGLMVHEIPAPQIFNHGPKSVVFNWSDDFNNLYLTVSADKMSALISSPERIKQRFEFSANELMDWPRILPSIRAAYLEQPVVLAITGTVIDPQVSRLT